MEDDTEFVSEEDWFDGLSDQNDHTEQEAANRSTLRLTIQPSKDTVETSTDHDSLKHRLLGPSLTKAGQDSVDQRKVSEIIYNASKGSKFFNNEEVKDQALTQKIERILAKKAQLQKLDLSSDERRADDYLSELELSRDLCQTIIHIDCDAFYAAVEELDRPELKYLPFSVGVGVLTTCNYEARKFGCRSAMAGFVAKKLCPQLIQLPLNFDKYVAKATEVRAILAVYDPNYESASIDEAYLNITSYCQQHQLEPQEAVCQLRKEVEEKTRITISAGIAANAKIAKIASNVNKPNGQCFIPSDRTSILAFMRELPVRKVNGVGRVFERELKAIGVETCGDIYHNRKYLAKLFGDKAYQFLLQCYLGIGRTSVAPPEESHRKSVGTESTFRDKSGEELYDQLKHTAEELEKDLARTQFKGRTLVLKIKLSTYAVYTRQVGPPKAINTAEDLYKYSEPMLKKLEKEFPNMRLRLMGLRCTHLISTKKPGNDFFGPRSGTEKRVVSREGSDDGWEKWPEEEFEEAARQERQEEMNEMERLSQEIAQTAAGTGDTAAPKPIETWDCPVCSRPQPADDTLFNIHIDTCLSRETIKEAIQEISEVKQKLPLSDHGVKTKRKGTTPTVSDIQTKRKRLFFS